MALKRLATDEMLHISSAWLDPKSNAHKAILAVPDLKPSVQRLSAAHAVLAAAAQPAAEDPRLAEISAAQAKIDLRHDAILRGIHALLSGSADVLGGDGGAELVSLRDTLLPDGLKSTQKGYRAEAGQAAQLAGRLTPELRAQLDAIVVGPKGSKKTLGQFVDEWLSLAKQLGELEDEKARLQPSPKDNTVGPSGALLAARNQWVRVVNALVANGEAAELDAETDALLFGPLRDAERKADRRARAARPEKGGNGADGAPPQGGTAGAAGAAAGASAESGAAKKGNG